MPVVVIVTEVAFKVEEEEGGGGIDRFAIDPIDKAERNIIHLLPFLPIPAVPMLPQCSSLPDLAIYLFSSLTPSRYPLCPLPRYFYAHHNLHPKTSISVFPTSLLLLVPHLRRWLHLHLPVSSSLISPLSCISASIIVHRLYPPLKPSTIPILSRISAASVVILPYLHCDHCRIIFHCTASFNAVNFLRMSWVSISHYSLSLYLSLFLI